LRRIRVLTLPSLLCNAILRLSSVQALPFKKGKVLLTRTFEVKFDIPSPALPQPFPGGREFFLAFRSQFSFNFNFFTPCSLKEDVSKIDLENATKSPL